MRSPLSPLIPYILMNILTLHRAKVNTMRGCRGRIKKIVNFIRLSKRSIITRNLAIIRRGGTAGHPYGLSRPQKVALQQCLLCGNVPRGVEDAAPYKYICRFFDRLNNCKFFDLQLLGGGFQQGIRLFDAEGAGAQCQVKIAAVAVGAPRHLLAVGAAGAVGGVHVALQLVKGGIRH